MESSAAPAPVTVRVGGMSCQHCVRTVRETLAHVPGVSVVDVEVGAATLVPSDPRAGWTDVQPTVAAALEAAGYTLE